MILKDFIDLISKDKRNKERLKTVKKFAVGMGVVAAAGAAAGFLFAPKSGRETREDLKGKAVNTVDTIRDSGQKKIETVKGSAAHAVQELCNVIKDIHGKAEGVQKDIKDGYHEITQDIRQDTDKTVENISNEFNKSIK